MATTIWYLGSYPDLPAQTVNVGSDATVPAGDYYLHDPASAARSLLEVTQTALVSGGGAGADVFLTESGKVRIEFSGSESVTLPATLGGLLGFTTLSWTADGRTADELSPLFWSPGRPEISMGAPQGSTGRIVRDVVQGRAPGKRKSTYQNEWREVRHVFPFLAQDRVQTTDEDAGEFFVFWQNVVSLSRQLIAIRNVAEDRTDETTESVLTGTRLGPYVAALSDAGGDGASFRYQRSSGFEWTDAKADVSLDLETIGEFS